MMRPIKTRIFLLLAAVFLSASFVVPSFAKKKTTKQKTPISTDSIPQNERRRFDYYYQGAINQQTIGNLSSAYELLSHALEINPNAAEAYFTKGAFDVLLKDDSLALQDYTKATKLSPGNNTYLERLAQFYIKDGKYDKATALYERLYANNYNRSDVLDILVQLYGQSKNYPEMLRTLNRLETEDGASEQLTLQKMQVYDMQGDKKSAYNELAKLADSHPYEANYRLMLGNWLLNNGREREALQCFNDVLKEDNDNVGAQMSLLDYYKSQGDNNLFKQQLEGLLLNKKTPEDAKVKLIQKFWTDNEQNGGDSTVVLNMFKRMLAQPQASATTMKLLAAYMQVKQMPKDSINSVLHEILRIEPEDAAARLQLIQAEWAKNNRKGVIDLCKPALQYNPDEMAFYYFLGIAYYQENQDKEALNVLRQGANRIKSDTNADLVSDLYAVMGDILHGKGEYAQAYEAYDSCLHWKPDNYECLNNYAYFVCQNGENLEKAEQMSFKTIQAEPKNSTYLDTYAWILFMEKRYEEAAIYIEQAVKYEDKNAPSAVVAEHAGDIYAMTGNTDKAVEYWTKASLTDDCSNKDLLKKKIRLKKYITK